MTSRLITAIDEHASARQEEKTDFEVSQICCHFYFCWKFLCHLSFRSFDGSQFAYYGTIDVCCSRAFRVPLPSFSRGSFSSLFSGWRKSHRTKSPCALSCIWILVFMSCRSSSFIEFYHLSLHPTAVCPMRRRTVINFVKSHFIRWVSLLVLSTRTLSVFRVPLFSLVHSSAGGLHSTGVDHCVSMLINSFGKLLCSFFAY